MKNPVYLLCSVVCIATVTHARAEVVTFADEAAYLAELAARGYTDLVEDFEGTDWDHVRSDYPVMHSAPWVTSQGLTWSGNEEISTNQNWGRFGTWGIFTIYSPPAPTLDELFIESEIPLFGAAGWFNSNPDFGADIVIEINGEPVADRRIGAGHQFLGVIVTCGFTSLRITDGDAEAVWGADDFTFATGGEFEDCNSNGIGDACEIADGTAEDCNFSGVPDECEVASGASEDCDGNGVPDECDVLTANEYDSGQLSPIGSGASQSFTIPAPPPTRADVVLDFEAYANLGGQDQYLDVDLNGLAVGRIFELTGSDCPELGPDEARIMIPQAVFNDALGGGDAVIRMVASAEVAIDECDLPSYVRVIATLFVPSAADADGDGIPDACESTGDLDGDGVIDLEDYALFAACLAGPDVTESPPGCEPEQFSAADLEGDDGDVDVADFAVLMLHF